MGPTTIATIAPIATLSSTKRVSESVAGDNIQKPIMAISPPKNPPTIPHLNRSLNLLIIFLFKLIYFPRTNTDRPKIIIAIPNIRTILYVLVLGI